MKDKTDDVAIEKFVRLKPKIYSLIDLFHDSRQHKEAKGLNKNVVVTIRLSEYKDVLLNNKGLEALDE